MRALTLLATSVVVMAGCKHDVKCGPGTELKDGVCVADQHASTTSAAAGNPPVNDMIAATQTFADRLCACADKKDPDCFKKVQGDMQKWMVDNADAIRNFKPTAQEQQQATVIGQKMNGCMQQMSPSAEVSASAGSGAPAVDQGPAAASSGAKLNELVKFANSEWTVLKALPKGRHLASNNQFQKAASIDEGKFVLVAFKVKNGLSAKAFIKEPKIRDAQGRTFEPFEEGAFYVPDGKKTAGIGEDVPPSMTREFWEPYQVADDSTGLTLLTHDLGGDMFDDSGPETAVALGL